MTEQQWWHKEELGAARTYRQNDDGSWSPAEPMGWAEEHTWLERVILWLRRKPHCGTGRHGMWAAEQEVLDDERKQRCPHRGVIAWSKQHEHWSCVVCGERFVPVTYERTQE